MANAIFSFITNALVQVTAILLTPFLSGFALLFQSFFANQDFITPIISFVTAVSILFNNVGSFLSFALSYFAVPAPVITLLFLYTLFKIQVWLLIEVVKFFVYWWKVIKL